jgi:hypothetical protein
MSADGTRELPGWLPDCLPLSVSLVNPDGANIGVHVTERRNGRLVLVLQGGMWRCSLTPASVRALVRPVTDHERFEECRKRLLRRPRDKG